ncbi:hypothetical protein [Deinococcus multiflagellatus]|uniref:Uncharacterized protein n=1 Tax=Deinococcus multiflagellatus TaxID=1656887 RepID=A0ABW1ZPP3_9DEIO|nr:hypothetical protein [Deinococcus multiflagellatus]MBZ9715324.1 hypothetical protein [Deinococcus multiflagellatus]
MTYPWLRHWLARRRAARPLHRIPARHRVLHALRAGYTYVSQISRAYAVGISFVWACLDDLEDRGLARSWLEQLLPDADHPARRGYHLTLAGTVEAQEVLGDGEQVDVALATLEAFERGQT